MKKLASGGLLQRNKDHALIGNYTGCGEGHIRLIGLD